MRAQVGNLPGEQKKLTVVFIMRGILTHLLMACRLS